MGAQASRLTKAGGDYNTARLQFENEIKSGGAHLSRDQQSFLQRDPEGFYNKYLNQSTKGKFSGPLGGVAKFASKVAPVALAFSPLGPVAAGAASAAIGKLSGKSFGQSLLQGAGTAGGKLLFNKLKAPGAGVGGEAGPSLFSKLGSVAGKTLKGTFMTPEGGLDMQRILGAGGAVAGLAGNIQQRNAANRTLSGQNDVRNLLISRLLERPNYNFQPTE